MDLRTVSQHQVTEERREYFFFFKMIVNKNLLALQKQGFLAVINKTLHQSLEMQIKTMMRYYFIPTVITVKKY